MARASWRRLFAIPLDDDYRRAAVDLGHGLFDGALQSVDDDRRRLGSMLAGDPGKLTGEGLFDAAR